MLEPKTVKVGFSGTRIGLSEQQKSGLSTLFKSLRMTHFFHGDCVGADAEAHDVAQELIGRRHIFIHPPSDARLRAFKGSPNIATPKDYRTRNRDIVRATDVLVACPKEMDTYWVSDGGGGTWYTIRYAMEMEKLVFVLMPDGTLASR